MIRYFAQKGRDPAYRLCGPLVSRIKISDQEAHLPQHDRGVNNRSRQYAGLYFLRKSPLKLVDNHAGVEKYTLPGDLRLIKKVKVCLIPEGERVLFERRPAST